MNEHLHQEPGLEGEMPVLQHTLGNYELLRRLTVGGMGEVYLARQRSAFGREVAVKIMRPELVHDLTARRRFRQEAAVNAHLQHNHILSLIEFSEHEGRLFLVTPYVRGGTLAQRLQVGPLSLIEIYQLFTSLVQAVSYIHKRGVIHRDLKPSNILLDQAEDSKQVYVRLIDFGIATLPGTETEAVPLTSADEEVGTPLYMAPERIQGISTPGGDIYSLGIILYQMLTGKLPNEAQAAQLLGLMPPSLEHIVHACTAADPNQRFTSADDLLKAFEYAYHTLHQKSPSSLTLNQQPPLPQKPETGELRTLKNTENFEFKPTMSGTLPDGLLVHRAEIMVPPLPPKAITRSGSSGNLFSSNDYDAPTTSVSRDVTFHAQQASNLQRKKKSFFAGRSFLGCLSLAILGVLAVIGIMVYALFQASLTATISFAPKTQVVSQVINMTALPSQQKMNVSNATLPAPPISVTKEANQQGVTTGKADCVLGFLDCKQAVSLADVNNLTEDMRAGLENQISNDLANQAKQANSILLGVVHFVDGPIIAEPQVGTVSKTVGVKMSLQGFVETVRNNDIRDLAQATLKTQLAANFDFVADSVKFSAPVVQNINSTGDVKISVAAAGLALYKLSSQEIDDIRVHLQGSRLQDAQNYLQSLTGIDARTIAINLKFGDTLPTNIAQISVQALQPKDPPPVNLPTVPTGTASPTSTTAHTQRSERIM